MADDLTPSDLRKKVLEARAARDRALAGELRDADEFPDEPSFVELKGDADELAKFMREVQKRSPVPPVSESIPASIRRKANTRGGKIAAVVTLVVTAVVSALVKALADQGVFGP
jgi:hypothetical protein